MNSGRVTFTRLGGHVYLPIRKNSPKSETKKVANLFTPGSPDYGNVSFCCLSMVPTVRLPSIWFSAWRLGRCKQNGRLAESFPLFGRAAAGGLTV